jgi:hypothetical protein
LAEVCSHFCLCKIISIKILSDPKVSDPNPDVHSLFVLYNDQFFWGALGPCTVKWNKRMTVHAGLCSFQQKSGFCSIKLSEPLLKLRPRSDIIETVIANNEFLRIIILAFA